MQYDTQDQILSAGFAVVKQYDAALYERMDASPWLVSTDLMTALPDISPVDYMRVQHAFGVTDNMRTYINVSDIRRWANENHVPMQYFTADVLVHEFRHTSQTGGESSEAEIPAFRAGSAFARELPDPYGARIARLSDNGFMSAVMGGGY